MTLQAVFRDEVVPKELTPFHGAREAVALVALVALLAMLTDVASPAVKAELLEVSVLTNDSPNAYLAPGLLDAVHTDPFATLVFVCKLLLSMLARRTAAKLNTPFVSLTVLANGGATTLQAAFAPLSMLAHRAAPTLNAALAPLQIHVLDKHCSNK